MMTKLRSFSSALFLVLGCACAASSPLLLPALMLTSVMGASLTGASSASAQPADPADDRATSFHAVTAGAHDDVPGGLLLVAAYAVVLVLLVLYVVYVGAIQQGTQKEIVRLEKLVLARSAPEPAKKSKD